jgi:hypothetical protein
VVDPDERGKLLVAMVLVILLWLAIGFLVWMTP